MLMLHEGIRLSSVSYNTQITGLAIIFNPFIFATPCRRPLIVRTMHSVRSNSLSLKYPVAKM